MTRTSRSTIDPANRLQRALASVAWTPAALVVLRPALVTLLGLTWAW